MRKEKMENLNSRDREKDEQKDEETYGIAQYESTGAEPSFDNLRRMDKSTQADGAVSEKIPQSLTQHDIDLGTSNDFREPDIDADIIVFCTRKYIRQISVVYEEVKSSWT